MEDMWPIYSRRLCVLNYLANECLFCYGNTLRLENMQSHFVPIKMMYSFHCYDFRLRY